MAKVETLTDQGLIFDIGFYDGADTRFYLAKGFRVVAVEANPAAVSAGQLAFAAELASGALTLVRKAIWTESGIKIPFYIDPLEHSAWHSVHREAAERGGRQSEHVRVCTISAPELFDRYGIPRYLKCDIEGADDILVDQIAADGRKPDFLSVELFDRASIERLREAGYGRFQLVNQGHLSSFRPGRPSREGRYVDARFGGESSGLFGLDLPRAHWCNYETCLGRFDRWKSMHGGHNPWARVLKRIGRMTGRTWLDHSGWMDVHATTMEALSRVSTRPSPEYSPVR